MESKHSTYCMPDSLLYVYTMLKILVLSYNILYTRVKSYKEEQVYSVCQVGESCNQHIYMFYSNVHHLRLSSCNRRQP